jgi:hypothetical protein
MLTRRRGGRPPNPNALKHTGRSLNVLLPPSLWEKIDRLANANGLSLSEMARRMLAWSARANEEG